MKSNPCAGWAEITPSKTDILTDETAKEILEHDCHGVAVDCWKDPTPSGKPSVCAPINKLPANKGTTQ